MVPSLLSALLLVQATQSSVAGTVRDGESGEPLTSAIVALTDIDRSVMSDSAGRYLFRAVPPGPQHITVKQIGYAPRTLHALVPASGELEINIALRSVPMQLPVLVVRSTVILRSLDEGDSTASPDRGISVAALRNHPLLAEPDGLLGLTGGAIAASPESPSGVHVRGGASDQTAFLLDGIPIFSPYHAAGTFSAWNPDALERLEVFSAARSPAFPDVLSGTIAAVTRAPGSTVRAQGGVSTTQARLAVDGPLGVAGAGYLLSVRGGFPGVWAPDNDPSYLRSKTRDLLAKVETPGLGGRLRFLLYDTGNEIGATASPLSSTHPGPLRNVFHWHSRSLGAQWVGRAGKATLRLQAWSASGDADAGWIPPSTSPVEMAAERVDGGVQAVMEQNSSQATTVAGARFQWSRTGYWVGSAGDSPLDLSARTPMGTVFLQHERPLGERLKAQLAFSSTAFGSGIYLNPRAELRWRLSTPIVLSASYVRSHQFSQSLRNPESVVGNIFPADLYIGAAVPGVPIARSDRGVLAAEYRPVPGMRLAAQVYLTDYAGLLLVAPRGAEPFATTSFATGSGTAPGFAVDAALSGPRYGLLASYGWQRVRLEHADSTYAPVYGNDHLVELGAIVFPSPSFSIRAGATAVLGRRATGVTGAFEWEACNLVDHGCEFSGSPQATGSLGATRLPSYLRLDLSLRKHWHLSIAGKDVTMALFGTITNLLGRTNILTVATDPATGSRSAIEMRPLAPLVAGLDWRF